MAVIRFIDSSGNMKSVDVQPGTSLMAGAIVNGIDGILGQCGGGCTCATCHCYIDEKDAARLPQIDSSEAEMLEYVADVRRPTSRLACKIIVAADMNDLKVTIPAIQI